MDVGTVLSIVSIVVTVMLSIGAIVLSVWFYKESNKQNKEISLIQSDIKQAISKLEKIYDMTYTDTFGALKSQMDAMQKYIFSSSIGDTNNNKPNELKFQILGRVSQQEIINIDELCSEIKSFDKTKITEVIYEIHREGVIHFDGKVITNTKKIIPPSDSKSKGVESD